MKFVNRFLVGLILLVCAGVALKYLSGSTSSAQPAVAPADIGAVMGPSIVTHVVTLKLEDQRGEPRLVTGRTSFHKPVQAYWVSLVGVDLKFQGTTEKYVNREMFSVDPFAKVINRKDVEVSGKLGIRDGSGDWDDTYEGTITIAVTAVMANR